LSFFVLHSSQHVDFFLVPFFPRFVISRQEGRSWSAQVLRSSLLFTLLMALVRPRRCGKNFFGSRCNFRFSWRGKRCSHVRRPMRLIGQNVLGCSKKPTNTAPRPPPPTHSHPPPPAPLTHPNRPAPPPPLAPFSVQSRGFSHF